MFYSLYWPLSFLTLPLVFKHYLSWKEMPAWFLMQKGKPWRLLHLSYSHIFPSEFLDIWFHLKHIQLKNQFPCQKHPLCALCCWNSLLYTFIFSTHPSVACSHDRQKLLIRYHGNSCVFHIFDSLSLKSSMIWAPATINKTDKENLTKHRGVSTIELVRPAIELQSLTKLSVRWA